MSAKPNYRVLRVDLSREIVSKEDLDENIAQKFLGGAGFAAKTLWEETRADTDPLSEDNPLIFAVGPMTATPVPFSGRYIAAAISPETNIWGQGHAGGTWAAALRRAGYIAIVVKGKANRPVYLWVNDGEVKLVDAHHVWGMGTYDVEPALRKETDERASVTAIGPAGEKIVPIANILSDGPRARCIGRCGLGAVMGSKKLKAIVVRGTGKPKLYDDEKLRESVHRYFPRTREWETMKANPGANRVVTAFNQRACIKNFQLGTFDGFADKLVEYRKNPNLQSIPCSHCPTGCTGPRILNGRRMIHGELELPMGSNCLVDDYDIFEQANTMCNQYGVDAISAGDALAMAMECYEKGVLTKRDMDGIDLTWGNGKALIQMLQKIADGEGFGKVLGSGVKRAADQIGGIAQEYAIHVKGLGVSLHDPRASNGIALQNATSSRGADHVDGFEVLYTYYLKDVYPGYGYEQHGIAFPYISAKAKEAAVNPFAVEGMGELVAWAQNFSNMRDSLVLCMYAAHPVAWVRKTEETYWGPALTQWAEYLQLVTGWDVDANELIRTGERIFNLKRMFNVRRGISRKDDTLPPRLLTLKRKAGPAAENLPPLGAMLSEYYDYRGWSEEGIPTKARLAKLGLE